MRLPLLLLVISVTAVLAQRRPQKSESQDTESPAQERQLTSRGRARFLKTPEFEKVVDDYEKETKVPKKRVEGVRRVASPAHTIDRRYEVQEAIDDIPDSRKYTKPKVITETKFEAVHAPTKTKLFDPAPTEPASSDELIKAFGGVEKDAELKKDAPTKVELPQGLEVETASSTENNDKLSSSTEQEALEEMNKELKKDATTQASTSATSARNEARRTSGRTRTRGSGSTTEAAPQRTRTRTRATRKPDSSESTQSPEANTNARTQFRSARRRVGQEQETLRGRGPSIIENHDEQPGRARNERRVSTPSRRKESDDATSTSTTEATRAARIDAARRSRSRRPESASTEAPTNSRRRSFARVETEATTKREQPKPTSRVASRGRTKSRFNPTEEVKVNPIPLVEAEPKPAPRAPIRSRGRTRAITNEEELIASSTVENPIRSLPDSSTQRSVTVSRRVESRPESNRIRSESKQRVKETVQSEISEVVSTRKVTRRKKVEATTKPLDVPTRGTEGTTRRAQVSVKVDEPRITVSQVITRGSKKSEVKLGRKEENDEDLDELNYPPQFKALILAKNKPKVKKGSRPEQNSVTAKSTTVFVEERVVQSVGKPIASTTPLASTIAPAAVTSTTTTTQTPSTTASTPSLSPASESTSYASSTGPASLTASSTHSLNVEDSENELFPRATRPPRRRFSVSTKSSLKKEPITTRKAKPTYPSRKVVIRSTEASVIHDEPVTTPKLQKFHARFNLNDATKAPEVERASAVPVLKRTYPTKQARVPYNRKGVKVPVKSFDDRKVIRSGKIAETAGIPAQVVPLAPAKNPNRYSSRYRSELRGATPARSSKLVPVYLPTVPTVTPTNQVSSGVLTEDKDGLQIISIDDPVNSLYSDNLISDNNTSQATVQQNEDAKPVSIIERIIQSITSISTTAKPSDDANAEPTGSSAILKIASKKPKAVEVTTTLVSPTTEKPTTIIERILNSLSAIQATDHVGTTHPTAHAKTSSLAPSTTPNPLGATSGSTLGGLLSLFHTKPSTKLVVATPKISAYTVSPLDNEVAQNVLYTSPLPLQISSTTVRKPSTAPLSTVAISLADYLASLGIGNRVKTTTLKPRSITPLPTTQGTTTNEVTTEATTTVVPSTTQEPTTTVVSSTTQETTTNVPTTTTSNPTTVTQTETTSDTITTTSNPTTVGETVTDQNSETTTQTATTLSLEQTTEATTDPSTFTTSDSPTKITFDLTTLIGDLSDLTTPPSSTEPFQVSLNSVSVISPNNGASPDNDPTTVTITSRSQPSQSINTKQSNRAGKLLNADVEEQISNDIAQPSTTTPRSRDYFIFAVLPNNTVVRKRPPMAVNAPYLIVGVYPNNTIVRKYPNGTIVPEEPAVQDSKNVVDIQANLLSLDTSVGGGNSTETPTTTVAATTVAATTVAATTTVATDAPKVDSNPTNADTNLTTLTELLGGKIAEDFKNIVNQTVESDNAAASDSGSLAQLRSKDGDKANEINSVATTTEAPTTTVTTTTEQATTTIMTTTMAATTTAQPATTTTTAPFTTTDLNSFIASYLSTLRPVYTPTTIVPNTITTEIPTTLQETTMTQTPTTTNRGKFRFPTTESNFIDETTYQPTVTITARRRTPAIRYTSTPVSVSTTTRQARRTTTFAPNTITTNEPVRRRTTTVPPTTTTNPPTTTARPTTVLTTTQDTRTTINPADVDIDVLLKNSNKKLSDAQLRDLEAIRALEKEQKALLEQLAFLTNLNIGQSTKAPPKGNSNGLANRILAFAMDRNKDGNTQKPQNPTTTEPGITIVQAVASATARQPKKVVLDNKGTTLDDILKEINEDNANSITDPTLSTYGKSQDAIIAAILKERGIEPITPKSLGDQIRQNNLFEDLTTPPSTTTRRPRPTTTQRPPGPVVQGLNWLLNAIAPPPSTRKPRPKPRPTTTTPGTTFFSTEFNEIFLPTEIHTTFQTTRSPRRPVNSLSGDELQNLIAQLEAIQKDPKQAQNLDLTPFKNLQKNAGTTKSLNNKNVEIIPSGTSGSNKVTRAPKFQDDDVPLVTNRGRQAKSTTISPVSVSNSIEDDEIVTNPRFRVVTSPTPTTARPTRSRATLPPVQLNPVPGLNENTPMIGGQFLNAAVNVTRAISTFLGSAIQGAAQSFQSMIGSGSRGVGSYFSSSSPRQG